MVFTRRSGFIIGLQISLALGGCAAKSPAPVVTAPATVVEAPDPAVIHKVWEEGYNAGYGAAESLKNRREEQEQDQLSNVPASVTAPVVAPTASSTPVADVPVPSGFQQIGPATPVSAGD